MTTFLDEAQVELVVLDILGELSWPRAFGPDIAFDGERPERTSYGDMVLVGRLREALARINPNVPEEAIDDAIRKVTRTESPSLVENNRRFHRMLTEGVPVEYHARDGRRIGGTGDPT
jgi:type I restriction enzyme R subunit